MCLNHWNEWSPMCRSERCRSRLFSEWETSCTWPTIASPSSRMTNEMKKSDDSGSTVVVFLDLIDWEGRSRKTRTCLVWVVLIWWILPIENHPASSRQCRRVWDGEDEVSKTEVTKCGHNGLRKIWDAQRSQPRFLCQELNARKSVGNPRMILNPCAPVRLDYLK